MKPVSKKTSTLDLGSKKSRKSMSKIKEQQLHELNKKRLIEMTTKIFENKDQLTLTKNEVMTIIDKFESFYTPKSFLNFLHGLRILMRLASEVR